MWVSPLCCSAHDKLLLFFQDLPSLICLCQIAALCVLCSTTSQPSPALPNSLAYMWIPLCNLAKLELRHSLTGQVEPDGQGSTPQEWHVSTPAAGCDELLLGCSCFPKGGHKRQSREVGSEQAVWVYLWYGQPPATRLNEGKRTRLNRKLSFTLVFGTCSYVLQRGINTVSTKVPFVSILCEILADDIAL